MLAIPSLYAADGVQEYSFNVGRFTTLKIQDNVNVVYHCHPDTTSILTYRATPEFDDAFIFTNHGGTLKIQVNTEDVGKPDLPTIHIYSDDVSKVENYSDFHLEIDNPAPCEEFSVSLMGNGSIDINGLNTKKLLARITAGNGIITLTGSTEKAEYRMTGAGTINATDLTAQDVICKIFGGGSISCDAEKRLKALGIGSTKIHYKGSPEIKHTGGGKLIPIEPTSNQ